MEYHISPSLRVDQSNVGASAETEWIMYWPMVLECCGKLMDAQLGEDRDFEGVVRQFRRSVGCQGFCLELLDAV